MTNKRKLKKYINSSCADLLAECVAVSLYSAKTNDDNVKALMFSILKLESCFIRRISHPEPGMKAKTYFKDLIDKFHAGVNEIIDQINNFN